MTTATKENVVKYGKIEIPMNDGTSPYMPQIGGKFVDHGEILKTLAIAIRDNLAVLLIGESGCLHPETPIYDPIDKTTKTVKESSLENKDFNVYALNEKQEIIITKAKNPESYTKTKMYQLSNGLHTITVTGKHRVWIGKEYKEINSFLNEGNTSCEILLPSISDISLSRLSLNDQHSLRKDEGSLNDYHPLSHSDDQQPLEAKDTDQDVSPLQSDVHEPDCDDCEKDESNHKEEYNHAWPSCDHRSTSNSVDQLNKKQSNESDILPAKDISSQTSQTPALSDKSVALESTEDVTEHNDQSSPESKQDELNVNLFSSYNNYSMWTVKLQQEETYYDFNVPEYENYWACGLFHHNTGKTSAIRYLANQTGNGLRRVNLNGGTTADELVGRQLINDKGTYWVDGVLTEAMRKGEWIVLDEINAALPEVLFVLQSVLDDDGYLVLNEKDDKEIVHKHANFRLFGTCNPPEYAGTKEMNKALLSRFAICINAEFPPEKIELDIIKHHLGDAISKSEMAIKLVGLANDTRKAKELGTADYVINTRDILNTLRLSENMEPAEALGLAFSNKLETCDKNALKSMARLHLPSSKKKATATREEVKDIEELKIGGMYIMDTDIHDAYFGIQDDQEKYEEMMLLKIYQ